MNTVYIVLILVILIISVINILSSADLIEWVGTLIIGIIIGAFLGFVVALFIPSEKKWVLDETHELQSFKDNSSLQGGFFLGTGSVNGYIKYTFYYKINGGFKLMQLDYEDVIIKYSNEKPKFEKYKEVCTEATINKYSLYFEHTKYTVYVPEGTIKQNYVLDAE